MITALFPQEDKLHKGRHYNFVYLFILIAVKQCLIKCVFNKFFLKEIKRKKKESRKKRKTVEIKEENKVMEKRRGKAEKDKWRYPEV